jgi:[acyl-carrier-protein] S-malonyltransferase
MGKALYDASPAARAVFEEVDEALCERLSRRMFDGPAETLALTLNAQPAIMAVSLAAFRVAQDLMGAGFLQRARFVAGHSLGEYSALCAAGVFTLADTARLLRLRGEAMQAAVPAGEGAMAAILGLELPAVEAIAAQAAEGEVCAAANDNAPGQVVVSGHATAVARAIVRAKGAGARRAILLQVSAPFHCALMQPAADAMDAALKTISMQAPFVPLIANVTAAPETGVDSIARLLVAQVTGMVRWRESVGAMADMGVSRMLEFGGGVLTPIVKRCAPDVQGFSIETMAELEAALKAI